MSGPDIVIFGIGIVALSIFIWCFAIALLRKFNLIRKD